ncbi:hypothetical protein [Streptomyces sp. NPDC127039]|uniref:hypothetical protein n=1 Tax=Streptomyces sp. NPDC127039 TaxID=3347115 RepID=UPI0036584003
MSLNGGAHRPAEPYAQRRPLLLDRFAEDGSDALLAVAAHDDASVALCVPTPSGTGLPLP